LVQLLASTVCCVGLDCIGLLLVQGKMSALFLRHEGFLGAVGAFLKVHPMHVPTSSSAAAMAAAVAAAAAGADGGNAAAAAAAGRSSLKASDRNASTKVCSSTCLYVSVTARGQIVAAPTYYWVSCEIFVR
jgi:hypothetical protein